MSKKTVCLVSPRGFCTGVRSALEIFQKVRQSRQGTIYVLNELVHNRKVREDMLRSGAVFVTSPEDVPDKSTLLFGAHGVGLDAENTARRKQLDVIDACCPRVKRLHREAAETTEKNALIIFGNPDHPEVKGVAGHAGTKQVFIVKSVEEISRLPLELPDPVLLCQTTRDHLEIEAFTRKLKERYPALKAGGGVCNAVYKRQRAVEQLVPQVDAMIIAGSAHSSNANRMRDVALRMGKAAFLTDCSADLPDLSAYSRLGLGAGASTPDETVQEILRYLKDLGYQEEKMPSEHGSASQEEDR